jgi:hypothetical protein
MLKRARRQNGPHHATLCQKNPVHATLSQNSPGEHRPPKKDDYWGTCSCKQSETSCLRPCGYEQRWRGQRRPDRAHAPQLQPEHGAYAQPQTDEHPQLHSATRGVSLSQKRPEIHGLTFFAGETPKSSSSDSTSAAQRFFFSSLARLALLQGRFFRTTPVSTILLV